MQQQNCDQTISESKEESIAKALAALEQQPLPVQRPTISVGRVLLSHGLWLLLLGALIGGSFILCDRCSLARLWAAGASLLWLTLFLVFRLRKLCVDAVLLYQRLAPEKVRRSCLFEPSCSAYMLLSIEKYGTLHGVCKGVRRLCRCHHPNGGIDYP